MPKAKEYDVTFVAVTPQVETVRIGMKFDKSHLSREEADHLFCGSEIKAKLSVDKNANKDTKGQQTSLNTDYELKVSGTCRSYTVHPKYITASLTMTYEDALCEKLLHFRYRKGKITCNRTGNAPEKDGTDSGEEPTLYEGSEEPSDS